MALLKDRIKQLRESKGFLQKEFARKIGVSKPTVSAWEQGTRSPNSTQRKKICGIFGITESELFGEQDTSKHCDPEILTALKDPIAVLMLLVISKNYQSIKSIIKNSIDILPNLTPETRQALLALCK